MSILIKGMEMPKRCWEDDCPCLNKEYGFCQADDDKRYVYSNKPDWCPLVPVPPHGRLIEASVIWNLLYDYADSIGISNIVQFEKIMEAAFSKAPTIIPTIK